MRSPATLRGAVFGLSAAALFGVSAPLAKPLLATTGPLMLAGLLYLGGGLGLTLFRMARWGLRAEGPREAALETRDMGLMAAITVLGGVLGPVLMLVGLGRLTAISASLLLNLEGVFTILLAVTLFGEHLGGRTALATVSILAAAVLLGVGPGPLSGDVLGVLALAGACLCWAVDNNLTQRVSLKDPVRVVQVKALGAGIGALMLARMTGQHFPPEQVLWKALLLGTASYGASIVLDTYALRLLGAAREAAYFATAPFIGALAAVPLLGERLGAVQLAAGALMAAGVALLLRERHGHLHAHGALEHEHLHVHDAHHQHEHPPGVEVREPHSHPHRHAPLVHDHPHVPDAHHRHRHRHRP
ncbi:MAG: EamA family transporter [Myxococcaceae bacterium]|nr:EamA family transporter [Myxococcaceae bacterium]